VFREQPPLDRRARGYHGVPLEQAWHNKLAADYSLKFRGQVQGGVTLGVIPRAVCSPRMRTALRHLSTVSIMGPDIVNGETKFIRKRAPQEAEFLRV
jgi:hypothetical protein